MNDDSILLEILDYFETGRFKSARVMVEDEDSPFYRHDPAKQEKYKIMMEIRQILFSPNLRDKEHQLDLRLLIYQGPQSSPSFRLSALGDLVRTLAHKDPDAFQDATTGKELLERLTALY